jgi:light-independent protochlorophyllide reductase subunit B
MCTLDRLVVPLFEAIYTDSSTSLTLETLFNDLRQHCETAFGQRFTKTVPIGAAATRAFIAEVAALAGTALRPDEARLRQPWWAASVDSTYLTGKRVFLFGDATHVIAAAKIARDEIGFEVCGMGCYNREQARALRATAKAFGVEPLITDDYLEVEAAIAALQPELILGTQMERHIGKRLGIPCAVISAPVHVQDFPARHSPQMGFEGANVIFDTWIHPLVMGLEEHLLHMFRDDFEFHDAAGPSHHGGHAPRALADAPGALPPETQDISEQKMPAVAAAGRPDAAAPAADSIVWLSDAERELKKIPFFVRGKARRNTENFAAQKGLNEISIDTLYEAKAHYAR